MKKNEGNKDELIELIAELRKDKNWGRIQISNHITKRYPNKFFRIKKNGEKKIFTKYGIQEIVRDNFDAIVKPDPVVTDFSLEKTGPVYFKTPGIHVFSGCWHFPFHNKFMYEGVRNLILDLGEKVKGFHLLGDVLDMNSLSSHDRGSKPLDGVDLAMEYREGNLALDGFDNVLPNKIDKSFIWGNHEDRYVRYMKDVDNAKLGDALPSPTVALGLKDRGYKVKENWREDYFTYGDHLQGMHGFFCTRNPARTHIDRLKGSAIFVHTHRVDVCYDGEKAGFNIGWGGDKDHPAFGYVPRLTKMNWINGFALVHIDKEGFFHVQVIPVYKNHFWFNGKRY